MQRFARLLRDGLSAAGHTVALLSPTPVLGRNTRVPAELAKWLGYVDKFTLFPPTLRSAARSADVVHICDHSNSIYVDHIADRPHVVTCHDVLAIRSAQGDIPGINTRWTGRRLQRLILGGIRKASHVVCVSEATCRELERTSGIPPERTSVIHNSLNYPYHPMAPHEAEPRIRALCYGLRAPFLLHVGGNQWYKNRLGVLRLFRRVVRRDKRFHLVMAGKAFTGDMKAYVNRHSLRGVVHELTSVPEEDLRALYSSASALVFPSLQEGFGWPIIEAHACGCPVVTSDRPPMTDIGGSACVYVNPEDPESGASGFFAVCDRRMELAKAGLQNASQFSVEKMIAEYVETYRRVNPAKRETLRTPTLTTHGR